MKIEIDVNGLLSQIEMLPPIEYAGQTVISSDGYYFMAKGESDLSWTIVFPVTPSTKYY